MWFAPCRRISVINLNWDQCVSSMDKRCSEVPFINYKKTDMTTVQIDFNCFSFYSQLCTNIRMKFDSKKYR